VTVKAQEVVCPTRIEINDLLSPPPKFDGWEVKRSDAKQILDGFQINFGDPKVSDGAIYDDVKIIKSASKGVEKIYIWNLKNIKNPYAICEYTFTSFNLVATVEKLSRCELHTIQKHPESKERIISAKCF
jgi:hypothetical protein